MGLPIKMSLPEGFLKPEVRCGYEVTEKLKKIWAVQLDLLQEFERVCSKHQIKWVLAYGSLLGAVRHKGFIPWDDDLDVCMLRSDYDKLCRYASSEFRHPYFLQTDYNNQRYVTVNPRFRNSDTTGIVKGQASLDYNGGIYLDVYILDGLPERRWKYVVQGVIIVAVQRCMALYKRINKTGERSLIYGGLLWLFARVRGMYNKRANRFVPRSAFFGWRKSDHYILKEDILKAVEVDYEWTKAWVPNGYDRILKSLYGDYMKFPPANEIGKWHEGQILYDPERSYLDVVKEGL